MTGVALAHCILGNFLGVVCHCFPPPLDVPTFAVRCLYVRNDVRDPSSERWNCGREICPVILPKFRLPRKFRDLLHAVKIYDMGPTALLPLRRKACWGFFRPKNPTAPAGFEPANLDTKGQHATPRPPKPCKNNTIQEFIILLYVIYCTIFIIYYSLDSPSSLITELVCLVGKGRLKERCGLEPRTYFFFRLRNRQRLVRIRCENIRYYASLRVFVLYSTISW